MGLHRVITVDAFEFFIEFDFVKALSEAETFHSMKLVVEAASPKVRLPFAFFSVEILDLAGQSERPDCECAPEVGNGFAGPVAQFHVPDIGLVSVGNDNLRLAP